MAAAAAVIVGGLPGFIRTWQLPRRHRCALPESQQAKSHPNTHPNTHLNTHPNTRAPSRLTPHANTPRHASPSIPPAHCSQRFPFLEPELPSRQGAADGLAVHSAGIELQHSDVVAEGSRLVLLVAATLEGTGNKDKSRSAGTLNGTVHFAGACIQGAASCCWVQDLPARLATCLPATQPCASACLPALLAHMVVFTVCSASKVPGCGS